MKSIELKRFEKERTTLHVNMPRYTGAVVTADDVDHAVLSS
jgi:hypothetical protein